MKKTFIALLMLMGQAVLGASLSGNITAADGSLGPLYLGAKESATYSLADFGTATIVLQRSQSPNGPWETLASYTANQSSTTYYNQLEQPAYVRLYAKAYTSGTIAATLADVDGDVTETIHFNRYKQQEAIQLDDQSRAVFPNGTVTDGDIDMGAVTMDGPLLVGTTAAAAGIVGHSLATGWLELQGDATSGATGAYLRIYGASHATLANDVLIGSGATTVFNYDDSAGRIALGYETRIGSGAVQPKLLLNAVPGGGGVIGNVIDNGNLQFFGGAGASGSYLRIYGPTHSTLAGDYQISSGSANVFYYDHDVVGIGFFGATPVARASAYTQTYATADKTHATPTAGALTITTHGAGTNDGTIDEITTGGAAADQAPVIAAIQELADQIGKLRADALDTKQLVNAVIDDMQAYGLMQ